MDGKEGMEDGDWKKKGRKIEGQAPKTSVQQV